MSGLFHPPPLLNRRRSSTIPSSSKSDSAAPPTDPLPRDATRPSDILINRLHELKRITKSLAAYFDGLASAHSSHSSTLAKLSLPSTIQYPLPESSLFLPSPPAKGAQGGWADLLVQIKDNNKAAADEHLLLSKGLMKDVVTPMKKLRVDIKAHISSIEKDVSKLAELVTKERELSATALGALAKALVAHSDVTAEDPFLLRAAAETQMRAQVVKENELLRVVLLWQEKTEVLEKEVWGKVESYWGIFETANSHLHLTNQQRSVFLSANVDSVSPDAEWNYFAKLNHLIPATTPLRQPEEITYPNRDDPLTAVVREGVLERQKRFVKTWKSSFFVLTPSGNLHEYRTSSSPLAVPTISLALAGCTLGPMPTPEVSTKGKQLDAMFTIEGPESKNIFRAKSWEELGSWWVEIEKFTKATPTNAPPPESDASIAARAGVVSPVASPLSSPPLESDGDLGGPSQQLGSVAEESEPATPKMDEHAFEGDIGSSVPERRQVPAPPPQIESLQLDRSPLLSESTEAPPEGEWKPEEVPLPLSPN